MISIYKQDGEIMYGVKDYVVDTREDILSLPTDKHVKAGSSALVIETGDVFMLNNEREWVCIGGIGGSSGGGSAASGDNAGMLYTF